MPLDPKRAIITHRDHNLPCPYVAMVARTVDKKERDATPVAYQAVKKEWDKLRAWKDPPCWDEGHPRELKHVRDEALRTNQTYHFGRIFDICVEKGSKLPEGDPARKFKGRAVFQGNRVLDENWEQAMFGEFGASPASMQAVKVCDIVGLFPGFGAEQADGSQADTQIILRGARTWVELHREQWPKWWEEHGSHRPVCELFRALYGHPDSGTYWEDHCASNMAKV